MGVLWITDNPSGPVREAVAERLPVSGAGDFSVMALWVDRLDDALTRLQAYRENAATKEGMPQLRYSDAKDLAGLVGVLRQSGIHATITDIAGGFYQG